MAYWGQADYGLIPKTPRVDVAIFCYDFKDAFGISWDDFRKPIPAAVSSFRKLKSNAVPLHAKAAGHYVNAMLARWDAKQKGGSDAILLDDAGNLAEGPVSSVFVVRAGAVRTARLEYVLAGITRDSVIRVTRDLGIPFFEADIPAADLARVDEAFYSGTHTRVQPITAIDGRSLGACPGPVTARIQKAVEDAYDGKDRRYAAWLDYV